MAKLGSIDYKFKFALLVFACFNLSGANFSQSVDRRSSTRQLFSPYLAPDVFLSSGVK